MNVLSPFSKKRRVKVSITPSIPAPITIISSGKPVYLARPAKSSSGSGYLSGEMSFRASKTLGLGP